MMPASSTEQRLHDAMDRLLEGQSLHTDGRLTVTNLALEARVSRATANRYPAVLDQFRRTVQDRKQEMLATREPDRVEHGGHDHILAQQIQARAMLRWQEERRALRADVLPFRRPRAPDTG
jgi:hypothetical protein